MSNQWGHCAARLVLAMALAVVALVGNPVIGSAAPAQADRSAALQVRKPEREWQLARPHSAGPDSDESAQLVIDRAMTQLGISYAWSGGDAHGPTRGIRDGGAGDSFGDYQKTGFDCSGLMIYAFAPVIGYALPHHSGSLYTSGRRVPLSGKRPGDMLFWGSNGRIHHVALYIGNEQMIEAPRSGSAVRVTSVRHRGLMPYVTRLV